MTRPELHAFVGIVMDAREKHGDDIQLIIGRVIAHPGVPNISF